MTASDRPIIIVGNGAKEGMAEITALAEKLDAPVLTTFKGKGLISDHHPLAGGVLGRSGTPVASWFMNESDLIITFGVSFANHTGIADYKPIVQVDFDPMALGRFHPVSVPVQGHVGITAQAMLDACGDTARDGAAAEVADRWAIWREEKASRREDDHGEGINAAAAVPGAQRLCAGERDHAGRRRQQHLLVRPLLRGEGTVGDHVGLPRLDRLRPARRHGRLGRHPEPARLRRPTRWCRSRATVVSASTRWRSPPR